MSADARIGFMQGRLTPPVDGKIQAFPAAHWRDEFRHAETAGFALMEWTLDHVGLDRNPLMTPEGRAEIAALSDRHGLRVGSVTGDCFMQAPFWKAGGSEREALVGGMRAVVEAAGDLGARHIVVPLVDNGSLETDEEQASLLDGLAALDADLERAGCAIAFECDFPPARLAAFIAGLEPARYGINYDIGNSAALGYDPDEELAAYGDRIVNVHVKDRPRGGTTVPLGEGDADLPRVLAGLRAAGYRGAYILQTARDWTGRDVEAACRYRDMVRGWLDAA